MTILKVGKAPENIVHRGKCTFCRTEVEFERHEGTVTYCQRDGDFVSVRCPTCGKNIHSRLHGWEINHG